MAAKADAQKFIDETISNNKTVVFSKTYCPYCKMAKSALDDINAKYFLVELDERNDGDAMQDVLHEMTGGRSVPRVFVNKKCIGGGTETKNLKDSGELAKMIAA